MAEIETLFVTKLYRTSLLGELPSGFLAELESACLSIAADDRAGQRWAAHNGYPGYTSYASLDDLSWRSPPFAGLARVISAHGARFAKELAFDLGRRKLTLNGLWVNVLAPGGQHSGHIHPASVLSGTFYVALPEGARGLRLEDPRLPLMMAAPARRKGAPRECQSFITLAPVPGELVIWESWLRHEVPLNEAESPRISVSFNLA